MTRHPALRLALVACLAVPMLCAAADHGVVLLYHRISESGPASTRVAPERFAAHLDLIRQGGYQVLPLGKLLQWIYGGKEIPERAVAITFDDAYRSVGEVAYPMLQARGMPFTVFVATDVVDAGAGGFLSWPQMREMAAGGLATFGPHSRSHAHLEGLESSQEEGAKGARGMEIDGSLERLRSQLGDSVLEAFAYPFGEYSMETESLIAARGLYGLAQQSGAVGKETLATRIPRFPFYVGGDGNDRLLTALSSRPLVMDEENPSDVMIPEGAKAPTTFRVRPRPGDYRSEALTCFSATGERLMQRWDGAFFELTLPAMKPGRNKVNCTAPAKNGAGYYWFSRLWLLADRGGLWLRE